MDDHKRYDIKDAARYLGVAPSTLRYWEREGLASAERDRNNDYRRYSVHDLIDAGDIAFYRKLGVPVKTLKGYHALSLEELDVELASTQADIDRRIDELRAIGARLARQRELNACAARLMNGGMRMEEPAIGRLSPLDYASERQWKLLVNEPWRYGIIVDAAEPTAYREAVVDLPSDEGETLWPQKASRRVSAAGGAAQSLECLLKLDPTTNETNAPALFAEAAGKGLQADLLVGSYLLAATEKDARETRRWDYYRAWIICGPRCDDAP